MEAYDKHTREIPALLRAAWTGTAPYALTAAEMRPRLPALLAWAEGQQLIPLLCEGLMRVEGFSKVPEAVALAARVGAFAAHSAVQTELSERLCDGLEATGVEHMPLKGLWLKPLYPFPEWRVMGDVDILIHPADRERVTHLLMDMGYSAGAESDHEYHWHTPEGIPVELHKAPMPTYDRDLYAYFGDGWSRARPVEGYAYRRTLSAEDAYIYLVAHMAKHYRGGGVGVRYALDLFVLRRARVMDEAYLAHELDALGLSVFEACVRRLLRVWFADAAPNAATISMEKRLMGTGVYGDATAGAVAAGARLLPDGGHGARGRRYREVLFPSYEVMRLRRGSPAGGRWRLPLWWVERWWELLFLRDRRRRKRAQLAAVSDEAVAAYHADMAAVGLRVPPA